MHSQIPIKLAVPCCLFQLYTQSVLVAEMLVKCLFLALLTQCLALQEQNCTLVGRKENNLTIQLQVSQSSDFDFSGYIPAVELALSYINTNSCVLSDYHINVNYSDIVDPKVSRQHINPQSVYLTFCGYNIAQYICYIQYVQTPVSS